MILAGRCLCGAVSYRAAADAVFMANCHCRDCQRATGGAYAPAMMFAAGAVEVTGEAAWFHSQGGSGAGIERGFCGRCGSQLFVRLDAVPGLFGVRPGTLDDPAAYRPSLDFHVADAQPWDHMDPALPRQPGAPPR